MVFDARGVGAVHVRRDGRCSSSCRRGKLLEDGHVVVLQEAANPPSNRVGVLRTRDLDELDPEGPKEEPPGAQVPRTKRTTSDANASHDDLQNEERPLAWRIHAAGVRVDGDGVELRESDLGTLRPAVVLERPVPFVRAPLCVTQDTSRTNGQHHERPVVFDDEEPGERAAIVTDEAHADGRLRDVCEPAKDVVKSRWPLSWHFVEHDIDERLSDVAQRWWLGKNASEITAKSAAATKPAAPFLMLS